jgi:hypothetical protein
MKYMKMLGLLATAAAALMAFASSASAGTITSPTGTAATSFTATAGATSRDGAFTTITCQSSHLAGRVTSQGASQTIKVNVNAFSFNGCNTPVHVQEFGTLEIHSIKKGIVPHETCLVNYCSGTVTSSGTRTEVTTSFGSCVFTTTSTPIGVLTDTDTTGGNAILDIQGSIPRTGGSFLCGSSATWTGSYNIASPATLWIDE